MEFVKKILPVKIEFIEPILGAVPRDKEIYTNYIASKAEKAESLKEEVKKIGVTEAVDKRTSGFLIDEDGCPLLSNHVIKGFFKEAGRSIRRLPGKEYESQKLSAFIQKTETLIHIYPRFIRLEVPDDLKDEITEYQRPCRASTPQGERITLKNSEMLPEGTTAEFEVHLMDVNHEKVVREWLEFGRYHGLGEWRNADYGRFEYMIKSS